MTYLESYMSLATVDEIKKKAIEDAMSKAIREKEVEHD